MPKYELELLEGLWSCFEEALDEAEK